MRGAGSAAGGAACASRVCAMTVLADGTGAARAACGADSGEGGGGGAISAAADIGCGVWGSADARSSGTGAATIRASCAGPTGDSGRICQAMPTANTIEAAIPNTAGQCGRDRRARAVEGVALSAAAGASPAAASPAGVDTDARAAARIAASSAAGGAWSWRRPIRPASARSSGDKGSSRFMPSVPHAACPSHSAAAISPFPGRRR